MVATFSDGLVTHEYTLPKKKELFLSCSCGNEVLKLEKWENEEEIYLSVYSFLAEKYNFWERLVILFGGKTRSCDVVLNKDEFNKLKRWKN